LEETVKIKPLEAIVLGKISEIENSIYKARKEALKAILDREQRLAIEQGLDMTDFASWSSYPQCWTSWAKTETHFSQYESNDGGNRYETHYSTEIVYGKIREYWKSVDLSLVPSPEADLLVQKLNEYLSGEEYGIHQYEQSLMEDYRFQDWIGNVWNNFNSSRNQNTESLMKEHFPLQLEHRGEVLSYHSIKETQVGCRWWVKDSVDSNWRVLEKDTLEWAIIGKYFELQLQKEHTKSEDNAEDKTTLGSMFADVFAQFK